MAGNGSIDGVDYPIFIGQIIDPAMAGSSKKRLGYNGDQQMQTGIEEHDSRVQTQVYVEDMETAKTLIAAQRKLRWQKTALAVVDSSGGVHTTCLVTEVIAMPPKQVGAIIIDGQTASSAVRVETNWIIRKLHTEGS